MAPKRKDRVGEGNYPDGWEKYERYSKSVEKLPIVVGKTLLVERYYERFREKIPHDKKFTPEMLRDAFDLGMVIDFTEQKTFYDPKVEFTDRGIKHLKIEFPGINKPLDENKIDTYLKTLDDYLHSEDSKGKVVYIHSTFGHYRCGYMLTRFLHDKLGYTKEDARNAFFDCRSVPKHNANGQKWLNSCPYSDDWPEGMEKPSEDWWCEAVEKQDLAEKLSQTHLGKGKQLAKKASSSSYLDSDQGVDYEIEAEIISTEPSPSINGGSNSGLNVHTKSSRDEEDEMESDAVGGPQQSGAPSKKPRIEELEESEF